MICCWSFKFGVEAFEMRRVSKWRRPRAVEDFGVVTASEWQNMVMRLEISSGWR